MILRSQYLARTMDDNMRGRSCGEGFSPGLTQNPVDRRLPWNREYSQRRSCSSSSRDELCDISITTVRKPEERQIGHDPQRRAPTVVETHENKCPWGPPSPHMNERLSRGSRGLSKAACVVLTYAKKRVQLWTLFNNAFTFPDDSSIEGSPFSVWVWTQAVEDVEMQEDLNTEAQNIQHNGMIHKMVSRRICSKGKQLVNTSQLLQKQRSVRCELVAACRESLRELFDIGDEVTANRDHVRKLLELERFQCPLEDRQVCIACFVTRILGILSVLGCWSSI